MVSFNLEEHLRKEHKRTAFSQYLREIVYGGNDGIVTTFAVVAGFAGAQKDPSVSAVPVVSVLLFGLANLFADGVSMSLGSFLSIRADQDVYRNEKEKELHEIKHSRGSEFEETIEILKRRNFSESDARAIAKLYQKNEAYWTEFMMTDELQMTSPENEKPALIGLATFCSFVFFGFIPLLPYVFKLQSLFQLSVVFTVTALVLLGVFRASVSKQQSIRGILETLLVGGSAAAVAYLVGSFFRS